MSVLGWLDGRPLPRTELDRRLARLRRGPRAGALPAPGSPEDRQLTRWAAQVLLTEALCAAEAQARGLDLDAAPAAHLDQRAAVELGSITAAAFEGCAAVRAVYRAVTAGIPTPVTPTEPAASTVAGSTGTRQREWHLSTADGDFPAALSSLPAGLAEVVEHAAIGETVTGGGFTVTVLGVRDAPQRQGRHDDGEAQRRLVFVRWLDHARAHRLRLVPGLEHPGDPAQPDNHHRH